MDKGCFATIEPRAMPNGDVTLKLYVFEATKKRFEKYLSSFNISMKYEGRYVEDELLVASAPYCLLSNPLQTDISRDGPIFYFDKMMFGQCLLTEVNIEGDEALLSMFDHRDDAQDAFFDLLGLQEVWGSRYFPHIWESIDNAGIDSLPRQKN